MRGSEGARELGRLLKKRRNRRGGRKEEKKTGKKKRTLSIELREDKGVRGRNGYGEGVPVHE